MRMGKVNKETSRQVDKYKVANMFTCLRDYLCTTSRQCHRLAHFCHCLLRDDSCAFRAILQYILHISGLGFKLSTFGTERLEMRVQVFREEFLAIHASDSCCATFNI